MSFSKNLQRIRKANKLSQEGLAELMEVSRQAVAKWESGQSYPDIIKLIDLSNFFKITIDDLLKKDEANNCSMKGKNSKEDELILSKEVINFLRRAKRATYAGDGLESISSRPNSHDIEYIEGNLKYIDTYLGGERFAGEEALWDKNIPFWSMNYIGRILNEEFSVAFLKEALLLVPEEYPFRGPLEYKNNDYMYICNIDGNVIWFNGVEEIYKNDVKVFECIFHGGLIKQ